MSRTVQRRTGKPIVAQVWVALLGLFIAAILIPRALRADRDLSVRERSNYLGSAPHGYRESAGSSVLRSRSRREPAAIPGGRSRLGRIHFRRC